MKRDAPSMFDIDFGAATKVIAKAASEVAHKVALRGNNEWQYKEGFAAYKAGKPLRMAMYATYYPDSRELWRMGWLTAMFIDLNNRDSIVMTKKPTTTITASTTTETTTKEAKGC